MNRTFLIAETEQLEQYGRILNAEDCALFPKDRKIQARHEARNLPPIHQTEADLPEHFRGPISRVMAKLMEGRVELRLPA